MKTRVATFFALMIVSFGFAQNCDVLPESALKTMKMDIQFLADDALEGRLPGTKGAMEAAY
jgi:hypothetical protein